MNINKITKTLLFSGVLAIGILPGCTNLEVDEVDSIIVETVDGVFQGDPTALLESSYNDLNAFGDQANIYALFNHTSEQMIPPTRGVDWGDNGVWRTLHAHTWDATHSYVLGAWNQLNSRVFKTNQVLASSPSAAQEAEARFLRAFYMWQVMDLYGAVPFREVNEGVDIDPKVFTRSEAFDFILQDLEAAIPGLPSGGPAAQQRTANKAAAYALMIRMYLNKAVYKASNPAGPYTHDAGDMTKVVEFADLIEAEGYSLETNYFDIFTVNSASEIIFSSSTNAQNRWMMTLHYSQNPSGWNGFTTLADFYDKFDANDSRIGNYPTPDGSEFSGIGRGFLIGQQYADDASKIVDTRTQKDLQFTRDVPLSGAATDKGIRVIKYHPADKGDYILFRFGEVVVSKAEAIMRGGSSSESALDVVNALRAARGADALSGLDDGAMLDERSREMYWESLGRIDQIRFGTFANTWSEKSSTETFRVLFPIPQQALDSNPNLQQNEGY